MAATAERFGQRPSDLLGIPVERDWLRYCIDEALHVLAAGHASRDQRWYDRMRDRDADGADLYAKGKREGGKLPSRSDLDALRYAAEHSGMRGADE